MREGGNNHATPSMLGYAACNTKTSGPMTVLGRVVLIVPLGICLAACETIQTPELSKVVRNSVAGFPTLSEEWLFADTHKKAEAHCRLEWYKHHKKPPDLTEGLAPLALGAFVANKLDLRTTTRRVGWAIGIWAMRHFGFRNDRDRYIKACVWAKDRCVKLVDKEAAKGEPKRRKCP